MYGVIWERKTEGSCPVGRATSEEVEKEKSGLRWVASLLPTATVKSGSELLLGFAFGFMALMQLGSVAVDGS